MILIALLASLAAIRLLRRKRRDLERRGEAKTFRGELAANAQVPLVTFALVSGLTFALSMYLESVADADKALAFEYRLETFFTLLLSVVDALRTGFWPSMVLLLLLFALAAYGVRAGDDEPAGSRLRAAAKCGSGFLARYTKVISVTYGAMAMVCTVTFLAPQYVASAHRLSFRIKGAEEDVARLGAAVEQIAQDALKDALLAAVIDSAPSPLRHSLARVDEQRLMELDLTARSREMRERLHLDSPGVRWVEWASTVREKAAVEVERTAEQGARARADEMSRVAASAPRVEPTSEFARATPAELQSAVGRVEEAGRAQAEKAAAVLQLTERQKVTGKIIGELIKSAQPDALATLLAEHPVAKIFVNVFERALGRVAEQRIEKEVFEPLVDRLKELALKDGGGVETMLHETIQRIARKEAGLAWAELTPRPDLPAVTAHRVDRLTAISKTLTVRAEQAERRMTRERRERGKRIRRKIARLVDRMPPNSDLYALWYGETQARYRASEVDAYLIGMVEAYEGKSLSHTSLAELEALEVLLDRYGGREALVVELARPGAFGTLGRSRFQAPEIGPLLESVGKLPGAEVVTEPKQVKPFRPLPIAPPLFEPGGPRLPTGEPFPRGPRRPGAPLRAKPRFARP